MGNLNHGPSNIKVYGCFDVYEGRAGATLHDTLLSTKEIDWAPWQTYKLVRCLIDKRIKVSFILKTEQDYRIKVLHRAAMMLHRICAI